ncbi:MAG TPA: tRNA (guanosine(46)-N7)-methyltransferase TrmB [Gammaproteobacteria bacterium]|nr:tRNA (guanosine(46)-N7)-methyltransferase TrmB [Gammaproteobacteria bacterium]
MTDKKPVHRPIRSFVIRAGRMTAAQQRGIDELLPVYGIEAGDQPIDFEQVFGRVAPVFLEIGFGMGQSLLETVRSHPQFNYLGLEVHQPGVGGLLHQADSLGLKNLRVINQDATEILQQRIAPQSLDGLNLYFPDPWHKKKHNKRRIVKNEFVSQVAAAIKSDGLFHIATDWDDYAQHIIQVMQQSAAFKNVSPADFSDRNGRPVSKYEQRARRLGHRVYDMLYHKL